jgi:hypothetical protein
MLQLRRCNDEEVNHNSYPILCPDTRHAGKFAHVVGHDHEALAACMAPDLHIMRAAWRARSFQLGADLPVVRRGLGRERQDLKASREMLDGLKILQTPLRFLGAVMQLPEGDTGKCRVAPRGG